MKIEMQTAMRFADGVVREGDVVELDKARAVAFVNAGYARWLPEEEPKPVKRTKKSGEPDALGG